MTRESASAGAEARRLVRRCPLAALGTGLGGEDEGRPYVSLVTAACDHDGAPLLLLSGLAQHSRNIRRDPRVSLLFAEALSRGAAGEAAEDPLASGRVTVLGRAEESAEPRLRARFLARHPAAGRYAGFADFTLFRVAVERAHLVAGFGQVRWIEGPKFLYGRDTAALRACEAEIVSHMNADHGQTLALLAERLLKIPAAGPQAPPWRMTGIDPEGCDLRRGGEVARVDFAAPVPDGEAARAELARLAALAREGG